ncbi:hypothetical protein K438DRAFT_1785787 [Mycena galopus ATCC 62051]|nr:hypothetical protein K438DRAFT_1785787 [Mycena galopus ATCC 62051]
MRKVLKGTHLGYKHLTTAACELVRDTQPTLRLGKDADAEGSDDSAAALRTSDMSSVLLASTLGTRLSPPPLGEREHEEGEAPCRAGGGEGDQADDPGVTYAIKAVWREAYAPLSHCWCTVCECGMAAQDGNASKVTTRPATTPISVPPAPTSTAKENTETTREKDSNGSPWVMHIPAEDETTAGAIFMHRSCVTKGPQQIFDLHITTAIFLGNNGKLGG